MKVHYTDPTSADYPEPWLRLSSHPPRVAYWGEPIWRTDRLISIVGSRTPMDDTINWMERHLPGVLKDLSLTVVSGGARGVDQLAHRLALECGQRTICILPSGLKKPYPAGVEPLLEKIVRAGGAVVSTYQDFEPLRRSHFAIRNRWIAGLSEVCFVAEANSRSGSMLTAQLARDEDKAVATLPVSPLSGQGLGNLQLLMDGAQLIRSAADLKCLWTYANEALRAKTN